MAEPLKIKITGDSSEFRSDIDKNIKKMMEISDKYKGVQNQLKDRGAEDFGKKLASSLEEVNKQLDEANNKLYTAEDKYNKAAEKAHELSESGASDDKQDRAYEAQRRAEEALSKAQAKVDKLEQKQADIVEKSTREYNAQTDALKLQSDELQQQFNIIEAINNQDLKELKGKGFKDFISNLKEGFSSIGSKMGGFLKVLTKPFSGISSIFKKGTLASASGAFSNMTGSVKNFTLALFGARTAFTLIRKAINEIMADNQQLSNTISTIWNSIVSFITPAVNAIVNTFATILNYVIAIISYISSVDVLGLMNKAQKKAAAKKKASGGGSSSKKKQEQQYSFDTAETIQKQDDSASGGSALDAATDSYLKQIKLNDDLLRYAEKLKAIWADIKKIGENLWNGIKDGLKYMNSGERILQVFKNLLDAILDDIKEMTEATVDWSANLNWGPLFDSIATVLESLEPILEQLGDAFVWVYTNCVLPFATYIIEELAPAFNNAIAPALDIICMLLEGLGELLQPLWENVLLPLFEYLGDTVVDLLDQLSVWLEENQADIQALIDFITTLGNIIINVFSTLVMPFVKSFFTFIKSVFGEFLTFATNVIQGVRGVFEGLMEFLEGIFTGNWEKVWNGIGNILISIWNTIISTIETGCNAIVDAMNFLIDGINGISFDLPGFLGGGHVGFDFNRFDHISLSGWKIPKLAQGAVIPPNKEFLALLGDQTRGRNIEAPESLLREVIQEESGAQEINIVANGDMAELIKLLRLKLQEEDTRVGKSLIAGT